MKEDPSTRPMSADLASLVPAAVGGDKRALEQLLLGVQQKVYALCLRFLWNRQDALDATQEILLKIATRLSTFEGKSKLSTWVYTVACRHLHDRRKSKAELGIQSFEHFAQCINAMPSTEPSPEQVAYIEEVRVGCLMGMFTCLDRKQRLTILLGEIMELGQDECAAILGLSEEAFRQALSRARSQLYAFLGGQCGLVHPENKCRCAKKTAGFIAAGIVDPKQMQFVEGHLASQKHRAYALQERMTPMLAGEVTEMFRQLPFGATPDLVSGLCAELFA